MFSNEGLHHRTQSVRYSIICHMSKLLQALDSILNTYPYQNIADDAARGVAGNVTTVQYYYCQMKSCVFAKADDVCVTGSYALWLLVMLDIKLWQVTRGWYPFSYHFWIPPYRVRGRLFVALRLPGMTKVPHQYNSVSKSQMIPRRLGIPGMLDQGTISS